MASHRAVSRFILRRRPACWGCAPQILPSVSWDSRGERSREEWQARITERHTYLIYCMWPDCRVFGFTWIQPFAAVVFHHLPPGTPSADTITEAVNTFWCELYTNNTCRAVEILPPSRPAYNFTAWVAVKKKKISQIKIKLMMFLIIRSSNKNYFFSKKGS